MPNTEFRKGISFAIAAYIFWGFAPLYFKLLHDIPAQEILIHRIVWSFVLLGIYMLFMGGFGQVRQICRQPKKVGILVITSLLIAGNWLLYIWAVNNNHLLDASLGYFINPLFSVVLAMIFLHERLRRLQWVAVVLAFAGVIIQLISFGSIPLVSLGLAASFGFYALLRKKIEVDAQAGLLIETAVLMPIALGYLFFSGHNLEANMLTNNWDLNLLLISSGVITTLPLLFFAIAAPRIPMVMLGFLQYTGPSIIFLLAVTVFGESFDIEKSITFGFIWVALVIFTLDMYLQRKRTKIH